MHLLFIGLVYHITTSSQYNIVNLIELALPELKYIYIIVTRVQNWYTKTIIIENYHVRTVYCETL